MTVAEFEEMTDLFQSDPLEALGKYCLNETAAIPEPETTPETEISHARILPERITRRHLDKIHPVTENDKLYRPIDCSDPKLIELSESIGEHGLLEPIVVTRDGYIVSGHRRHAACRMAGLTIVPVREIALVAADDIDRFMVFLKEFNRQRVKTLDEQMREAVLSIDPDDAYQALVDFREEKAKVKTTAITITGTKKRARITPAKDQMVKAIQQVLIDRAAFLPTSDRAIHYALLNKRPLKHASKPNSRYANDDPSYDSLTELLTRMRLTGDIPMDAIADETRPVTIWDSHSDPSTFMQHELDVFLKGYSRDLMQSQPNHIEVLCEKNTIQPICESIVQKYRIPLTSGRGFCSLPPRAGIASRYRNSGKQKLVILILSDHDPEGCEIAESFAKSLRDDFGIADIHPVRVALTHEQAIRFNLAQAGGATAKAGSSTRKKFVEKYGEEVFELEAIEPQVIQRLLTEAIDAELDRNAFNAELSREREDATWLAGKRKFLCDLMASGTEGGAE